MQRSTNEGLGLAAALANEVRGEKEIACEGARRPASWVLASRYRFGELEATVQGTAFWFYHLPVAAAQAATIERTWTNRHMELHGSLPVLNKAYSPVS